VVSVEENPERNFDALIAVQRSHKENDFVTQFAVAKFETVEKALVSENRSKGDQIKFSIENGKWDFLSSTHVDTSSPEERKVVSEFLDKEFRRDKAEQYEKYCNVMPIKLIPEDDS
jgi:hypothetical protein